MHLPLLLLSQMLFSASEPWKDGWKGEKETVNEGQDASAAAERKADFTTPLDDDDAREVCQKTWSSAAPRIAKALAAKLAAADNVRTMWFMQDNIIYWS